MLWNDIGYLVKINKSKNGTGDTIETITEKEVFINKKSIRQSEYYQALSAGLKPEIMIEIRSVDYEDEKNIKYNDKTFNIIRVYSKNNETTELICQEAI